MTFKKSVVWNRVTENLPENDKDYLVWTGNFMVVANAQVYSDKERREYAALVNDPLFSKSDKKTKDHWLTCRGQFCTAAGDSFPFNDPNIYWSELPLAPHEET